MERAKRIMRLLVALLALIALLPTAAAANVFGTDAGTLTRLEFEGDTLDTSGAGRHGVPLGAVTFVPTPFGQGARVDAFGESIDWSAHALLFAHPYTIEMVLTADEVSCWQKLVDFAVGDTGWYYCGDAFTSYPFASVGVVVAGQRHYLAMVSTSNNHVDVYIDGILVGGAGTIAMPPPGVNLFREDAAAHEQIEATVEAVRISSVTRTPAEIAATQACLADTGPCPTDLPPTPPVPELGSIALLGAGFVAIAGVAILRRRA